VLGYVTWSSTAWTTVRATIDPSARAPRATNCVRIGRSLIAIA
jgi:hypothetical protein